MKNNKGITLTSLIVTIIVMVILAGISLYMAVGDMGTTGRAEEAGRRTQQQTDKEILSNAINGNLTTDGVKINSVDDLKNNLPEGWIVEQTIDDNFMVTSPNSNVFIVKNVGKLEPSGEILELAEKVEQSGIELGTLDEIGITNDYYKKLFYIEDGKLVYREEIATESIKEKIEASGIEVGKTYYLIATEETKNDKYAEKANVGTINNFRDIINNGTFANNYKIAFLIENIDMGNREKSDGTWVDKNGNAAISWTPLEWYSKILDGQGYVISGLYIKTTAVHIGFMRGNSGTVKNLTIKGYISSGDVTGGLIAINDGDIINCTTDINTSTTGTYIGGICAKNNGTIKYCVSYSKVYSPSGYGGGVGGICGLNNLDSSVLYCKNYANLIQGSWNVGGIVGTNKGTIERCASLGELINSSSNYSGGIAGWNSGVISECYNKSKVNNGWQNCAGITGGNTEATGVIKNCYNVGQISSPWATAGLVGDALTGTCSNCYNIGKTVGGGGSISALTCIPGNGSTSQIDLSYCYSTNVTSNLSRSINIKFSSFKTEDELKSDEQITLLNTGNTEAVWVKDTKGINKGFPILAWQLEN